LFKSNLRQQRIKAESMGIFLRGNIWWYEFVFHGQRVRVSTGSKSKTLAIKAERKRRRDLEESANGIQAARRPLLFSTASKEWMAANQARWSKSNVSIQEFNLKHLSGSFRSMLLADITPAHIGKYQFKRQQENASNRTINMEVATLRMILKSERLWAVLAQDVKMLPERREVGRALTVEEEARLLAACRKSPSPSLFPAVVIFCNTGLRNAELRCARWAQVDLKKAEFHVGKAKTEGGTGRIVPLNLFAVQAFQFWSAHWPKAQPEDFIFPSEKLRFKGEGSADRGIMTPYKTDFTKPVGSWKKAWSTATKQAKVKCRIHDLRHHFITALSHTETLDTVIQGISGHQSRKMMDLYSHVRTEAMRTAVDQLAIEKAKSVMVQ
jgi:integrase